MGQTALLLAPQPAREGRTAAPVATLLGRRRRRRMVWQQSGGWGARATLWRM